MQSLFQMSDLGLLSYYLLPQTHSPGVDYSLFIMETVEMLLGVMETTPTAHLMAE